MSSIRSKLFEEATCLHPERETHARGLCVSCYNRTIARARRREKAAGIVVRSISAEVEAKLNAATCDHPERPRHGRSLCVSCYKRVYLKARAAGAKALRIIKPRSKLYAPWI
jgi:hypothetical protein